jgi:hypothetical protein
MHPTPRDGKMGTSDFFHKAKDGEDVFGNYWFIVNPG